MIYDYLRSYDMPTNYVLDPGIVKLVARRTVTVSNQGKLRGALPEALEVEGAF